MAAKEHITNLLEWNFLSIYFFIFIPLVLIFWLLYKIFIMFSWLFFTVYFMQFEIYHIIITKKISKFGRNWLEFLYNN